MDTDKKTMIDLVEAHNAVRKQEGKLALTVDVRLMAAAQLHAEWMRQNKRMSHKQGWLWGSTSADRVSRQKYAYRSYGENIASGQTEVDEVLAIWLNSRAHRANILGDFKDIGVGRSGNYWCVVFGTQL
jgi:uncharacterized protein YkwD